MTGAVVYIPPYLTNDADLADRGRQYASLRRYTGPVIKGIAAAVIVVRDWAIVEILRMRNYIQVVIVVRQEHREGAPLPVEVVEDEPELSTVVLIGRRVGRGGRHRAPTPSLIGHVMDLSAERVANSGEPATRNDGGFAERFLAARLQRSRHMSDT